jgi:hypothetical protein
MKEHTGWVRRGWKGDVSLGCIAAREQGASIDTMLQGGHPQGQAYAPKQTGVTQRTKETKGDAEGPKQWPDTMILVLR